MQTQFRPVSGTGSFLQILPQNDFLSVIILFYHFGLCGKKNKIKISVGNVIIVAWDTTCDAVRVVCHISTGSYRFQRCS